MASALTQAALALAREGGPEAVVLREAARRVGVSPSAAYRHFPDRQDLLRSVKHRAHELFADALDQALRAPVAQSAGERTDDPLARLRSLGVAYVHFALDERGLFRTAFCRLEPSQRGDPARAAARVASPPPPDEFRPSQLLSDAVDQLVELNLLPAQYSAPALIAAWSTVHGLATLLLDGPLLPVPDAQQDSVICGLVDVVVRGLTAAPVPRLPQPGP